jgi:hypothetical protein
MGMNIIEVIDKHGVQTTNKDLAHIRLKTPKPGDVITYAEGLPYPFRHEYGRVDSLKHYEDEGRITICCQGGSVFLNSNGTVSISGGPFAGVDLAHLKPTYTLKAVRFWNWGDNLPGASQGVDYYIERPVFLYQPPGINEVILHFEEFGERRIYAKDPACAIEQIKAINTRRKERPVSYADMILDGQAIHIFKDADTREWRYTV